MTNLSFPSSQLLALGTAVLSAGSAIFLAGTQGFVGPTIVATVICGLALCYALVTAWRREKIMKDIGRVSHEIRRGNFDSRLVFARLDHNTRKCVDAINGMIDINDAFVREASLALTAASEGRFYRKIRPEGMDGMFLFSVDKINLAIDMMKRAQQERAEVVKALKLQIGGTIEAAAAGDFTKLATVDKKDPEFAEIAEQVNALVETVDRGLKETGAVLSALANKDLRPRVNGQYLGQFQKLKQDTNSVADKLGEVISQLNVSSSGLSVASREILEGATSLSDRTIKQAATIEETSAAMEQLANTVGDNASRTEKTAEESLSLAKTAEKSGQVVARATDAMERITESSSKISEVIGMIDDIAFQTNLLALNASVEAARAGDAGKGFAVVAIEVRRLAQSAAESSAEVKALIEASTNEVTQGREFVLQVADDLKSMIDGITGNKTRMEELLASSRSQATAIDEIADAVRQMDETTQHNAALVEETNAAIAETDDQVSHLDKLIDQFQVEKSAAIVEMSRSTPDEPALERIAS